MEKEIKSVANVARADIGEFLKLAAEIPIRPEVQEYPLLRMPTGRCLSSSKAGSAAPRCSGSLEIEGRI